MSTPQHVLRSYRKRLFMAQFGLCHYCANPMTECDGVSPTSVTLDHVIPKSQGGSDHISNFVAACFACNQAKGDEMPAIVTRERPKKRRHKRKNAAPDAAICAERQARKAKARCKLGRRS